MWDSRGKKNQSSGGYQTLSSFAKRSGFSGTEEFA